MSIEQRLSKVEIQLIEAERRWPYVIRNFLGRGRYPDARRRRAAVLAFFLRVFCPTTIAVAIGGSSAIFAGLTLWQLHAQNSLLSMDLRNDAAQHWWEFSALAREESLELSKELEQINLFDGAEGRSPEETSEEIAGLGSAARSWLDRFEESLFYLVHPDSSQSMLRLQVEEQRSWIKRNTVTMEYARVIESATGKRWYVRRYDHMKLALVAKRLQVAEGDGWEFRTREAVAIGLSKRLRGLLEGHRKYVASVRSQMLRN